MASQEEIAHQQNLLQTYRQTLAHYLMQQASLGAAYAPPAVSFGIREARSNIQRIKATLRSWKVLVEDHPDDGDHNYEVPPPTLAPATPPAVDRIRLRQVLIDYFNDDELRDLCFDLGIDYENLAGAGKAGKARELIAYAQRRGTLEDLARQVKSLRPNVG